MRQRKSHSEKIFPFVPEEVDNWENYSVEDQKEIEEFYYLISNLFVLIEDADDVLDKLDNKVETI